MSVELNHPVLRVPMEKVHGTFRLFQKQMSKEIINILKEIEDLKSSTNQSNKEEVQAKLRDLSMKIKQLKQDTITSMSTQEKDLRTCITRAQYLTKEATFINGKEMNKNPLSDRLIVDYMLSKGFTETASTILKGQTNKGLRQLLDEDLYIERKRILMDLKAKNLSSAINWCNQYGSRLRRLQSLLEFHLRMQEFIEIVRLGKQTEAVNYAQSFFTFLAAQIENTETKERVDKEIQEAMGILAYKNPENCGLPSYTKYFSNDRWQMLGEEFEKNHRKVFAMHDPPSLCIVLHAGVSTLNTRACHRARKLKRDMNEKNSKADLPNKNKRHKTNKEYRRPVSPDSRDHQDGEIEEEEEEEEEEDLVEDEQEDLVAEEVEENNGDLGDEEQQKESEACCDVEKTMQVSKETNKRVFSQDKKRKAGPSVCPTCSDVGDKLTNGLPFAHQPHSRLLCRVTRTVMDENNPPVVLPNGYVYSRKAIEQMVTGRNGEIKCIETHEIFTLEEVKQVYII